MLGLALATAFFVGIHLFVSGTRLRDRLVGALGEGPYMGLFSLASVAGLAAMILAYRGAPTVLLWGPVLAGREVAIGLMALSFAAVVVGLTTPSPTAAGTAGLLDSPDAVRGVLRITRHPFLCGVALWSAVHVAWTGDLAGLVFFGGFGVLGLAGPHSIDAKRARHHGETWRRFAERTSVLPFAAVASGRVRLGGQVWREIGAWRIAAALAAWIGALWAHRWAFGVSPFPG